MAGLTPWKRRRGLLPSFFDIGPDIDDFFDPFSFQTVRTDLKETENEYILEADLPGCNKNEIEIRYDEEGTLTISAQQDEETEEKGENYIHRERRKGSFRRTIPVPNNVDSDAIRATYSNGVLKVILPKIKPSKPKGKKIDIE